MTPNRTRASSGPGRYAQRETGQQPDRRQTEALRHHRGDQLPRGGAQGDAQTELTGPPAPVECDDGVLPDGRDDQRARREQREQRRENPDGCGLGGNLVLERTQAGDGDAAVGLAKDAGDRRSERVDSAAVADVERGLAGRRRTITCREEDVARLTLTAASVEERVLDDADDLNACRLVGRPDSQNLADGRFARPQDLRRDGG